MGNDERKQTGKGLAFEIKCLEESIAIKEKMGKDTKFERELLKSWKKFQRAGQRAIPHS